VLVDDRVARVLLGNAASLAIERGREEQRLARTWARGHNSVHRRPETHVEHPVSLIENEYPNRVELDGAPGQQVF
jgi:hypothetical protein